MGSDPTTYNGGSLVAMCGKNCVAIASDLRFGIQAMTVGMDFPKIFPLDDDSGPKLCVGLSGLASDVQTLSTAIKAFTKSALIESQGSFPTSLLRPSTLASRISTMLYGQRFSPWFVEPIIAGIDESFDGNNSPFICSIDLLGSISIANDFVTSGTASSSLSGICESLWAPDMDQEQLFEAVSQALLSAMGRDALSGWGTVVHIITPEGRTIRHVECRMD
ncbi:proteasome core particle subunit beta 3 [Mitosporidium daphniae]|uniref:Beta type subunit of proteasome n=1 Tax=Mitosporidium daphniae TaxID=1485682 RepID=A0A098VSC0_9MICR|nr:beta type subunit of proteasome [Mitosporidium daphniae]KGG50646.1 beta type subunit of proteasome [Mitosporidium daphniae]|eukprot:XP_013237073.1 beta type subunit of proteasome [Mitosporidium daphniae]